jgi:hypothetical protein
MLPMLGLILGGMSLSLTPGYINNSNHSSYNYPKYVKPGVSDEYYESQQPREQATGREEMAYREQATGREEMAYREQATGREEIAYREQATDREEIAYMDERDRDIHQRANRKGDWGYRQNWRYNREAFYKGETQADAYDRETPDGVGGPGMDPDTEFLQMRKFYLEEQKHQNAANQKNNAGRSSANSQNNSYRTNNSNNRDISNQSSPYSQPAYPSRNMNDNSNYNNPNTNYNPNYNSNGYPTSGYYYQ